MKKRKCPRYEFVFRFDIYDGTESALQVYDAQVVQYKFVNQGTTICLIGNGMKLYPEYSGIAPHQVTLDIRQCEMDTTVYNYSFEPLDFIMKQAQIPATETTFAHTVPYIGLFEKFGDEQGQQSFNRLLVISKVKAKMKGGDFLKDEECDDC